MSNESKIESVEIHNFMAFKYAKATFDESGIINLKGYNNSGKTAFEMAIAICLMNIYPSKQGKYIRFDEKYFRVVVNFSDGISIVRDKYSTGQSLYEMYKGDKCIFTTKQGNQLSRVLDIPTPIKSYLNLVETSLGYLNYQTRRDPLWLVDTKGSENHAVLNEVFRTSEISRANAMINADINQLNSDISTVEAELQQRELRYDACVGVTEELVDCLEEKESAVSKLIERARHISHINKIYKEVSELRVLPEVEKIEDIDRLREVYTLSKKLKEISELRVLPQIDRVEGSGRLKDINELYNTVSQYEESLESYVGAEVGEIDYSRVSALSKLIDLYKQYSKVSKQVDGLNKQVSNLEVEIDRIVEEAKKEGIVYAKCENCGTLMEVNTK